jgi:phosphoserine phosphatase
MDSVLLLIAAPGSGAITSDIMKTLGRFGATAPQWLAPQEAVEFPLFSRANEAIAALKDFPIDTAIVPVHNRRKKMLLADMDSTMIHQECIDELGVVAGVGDHIKNITARAMRGELDFEAALMERVKLLKGLDTSIITTLLRERITFMEGGKTLLATMKANGAYAALVSGGFTSFTGPVAQLLGFDENRANTLLANNNILNGEVALPILGQEAKRQALFEISARLGLTPEDALCVGDGANDLAMIKAAGLGVALHAKPHVQEQSKYRINHGDLTALLYLQGYRHDDFIIK